MNQRLKNNSKDSVEVPENILLIDKPKGVSSFDVVRELRKKLNTRKVGHAGTLDPLASGLMLIGFDQGTKKLHELTGMEKTYYVEAQLGKKTATGDLEGDVVDNHPPVSTSLKHCQFNLVCHDPITSCCVYYSMNLF